jgi:hypothetical protein
MSLITPKLFSRVAGGVTCNGASDCVSLLREPDAANQHVRFDERVWKRKHGGAREAPTDEESATDRLHLNHRATPRLH